MVCNSKCIEGKSMHKYIAEQCIILSAKTRTCQATNRYRKWFKPLVVE